MIFDVIYILVKTEIKTEDGVPQSSSSLGCIQPAIKKCEYCEFLDNWMEQINVYFSKTGK